MGARPRLNLRERNSRTPLERLWSAQRTHLCRSHAPPSARGAQLRITLEQPPSAGQLVLEVDSLSRGRPRISGQRLSNVLQLAQEAAAHQVVALLTAPVVKARGATTASRPLAYL